MPLWYRSGIHIVGRFLVLIFVSLKEFLLVIKPFVCNQFPAIHTPDWNDHLSAIPILAQRFIFIPPVLFSLRKNSFFESIVPGQKYVICHQ